MNNQAANQEGTVVGGFRFGMAKTSTESMPQVKLLKQALKEHESRERGELLVSELKLGQSPGSALDLFTGKLHLGDPLWVIGVFLLFHNYTL